MDAQALRALQLRLDRLERTAVRYRRGTVDAASSPLDITLGGADITLHATLQSHPGYDGDPVDALIVGGSDLLVLTGPFVGQIAPSLRTTAPAGWLVCAGQAVSRTTYSALFAAIATAGGVGDGSTTFNVPDLRGRVPVGLDNLGGSDAGRLDISNTLGGSGGEQKHTLTIGEMPSHAHFLDQASSVGAGNVTPPASAGTSYPDNSVTDSTGGDQPHNNMPPYLLVTWHIYAGV